MSWIAYLMYYCSEDFTSSFFSFNKFYGNKDLAQEIYVHDHIHDHEEYFKIKKREENEKVEKKGSKKVKQRLAESKELNSKI